MSFLNLDIDLEQGRMSRSEQHSDAGIPGPSTGGQQPVERLESIRRSTSVDQGVGKLGSVRFTPPFTDVMNAEREGSARTRQRAPSVGPDNNQIPGSNAHPKGVDYGPGAIFGDPSRQMWTLSLSQFEKYDREITDRWKSESDGVLVFTGLFSATVASFVIEGYKGLSVDSGSQTVALLTQMSQQLVDISNGTILLTPPPLTNTPPHLASAVRVNILWLLSLGMSMTCALLATLIQQWSRRYMALSYLHDMPHERARVRTFLHGGMEHFRMRQAVEAIPLLLHTSVFLFFAGLVDFFLLFNNTVAWAFIGWFGLFLSVYMAMTVIPSVIFSCPYRTPFTGLLWRMARMLAVITLVLTDSFVKNFDDFLRRTLGLWGRINRGARTSIAPRFNREGLAKQIVTQKHLFSEGLHGCVVSKAIDASSSVDREALIWTLSKLDEDKEVEDYMSRVPGFFDSLVVPEALKTMLGLMDPPPSGGDSVLAVRLGGLLKTCLPTTSGIDSGVDKSRLNICLTALWCYTKGYNSKGVTMSKDFRGLFADQNEMNILLANDDLRTKVMVLCMGSLLVSKLVQEMDGKTENPQVSEGELLFLKRALGPLWRLDLATNKPTKFTNLDSMLTELEEVAKVHLPADETLGHEVLDTMHILAQGVVESIPSHSSTEHKEPDLSALTRAHWLLDRCLTLSKQCGADSHFGGLMRSDAFDAMVKMLEGLNVTLEQHADLNAQSEVHASVHGPDEPCMDKEVLASTLDEVHEDDEFEKFVARIPTLFGSYDVFNTSMDNMLDLMAPSSGTKSTLAPRLHKFFKASLPGKSTLDPDVRKRCLDVSLAAIWSYARAYCNSDPYTRPIPEHFLRQFADPNDMDLLSADDDTNTRVTVLCISSLLATKIVEDIRHRSGDPPVSDAELAFLRRALGSFWQPRLSPYGLGPTELATLLSTLDGLAKLAHQERSPLKTLGHEALETLDVLATVVKDNLPEDPPPEPWGSSPSVIRYSREALEQCLSLLQQLSEGEDGLLKGDWVEVLIGRLIDLNVKLSPAPDPGPQPPHLHTHTHAQTLSIGETPSAVNLLVTPTVEENPSEERYAATIREPELILGQQYSRVHTPFQYDLMQRHQG